MAIDFRPYPRAYQQLSDGCNLAKRSDIDWPGRPAGGASSLGLRLSARDKLRAPWRRPGTMELLMDIPISEACRLLEGLGALRRQPRDQSDGIVQQVRELFGGQMPADLEALYRERVKSVGDFAAILPKWNARSGGRRARSDRCCMPRLRQFSPTVAEASTGWICLQKVKGQPSASLTTKTSLNDRAGRQDHQSDASCCCSPSTIRPSARTVPPVGSGPSIQTSTNVPEHRRSGSPADPPHRSHTREFSR